VEEAMYLTQTCGPFLFLTETHKKQHIICTQNTVKQCILSCQPAELFPTLYWLYW
uniref:Uncharacterized protein n=1 Tax=Dicentrarchus labrax TaxID=13489 RepID=A0A8C4DWX4_DICLA